MLANFFRIIATCAILAYWSYSRQATLMKERPLTEDMDVAIVKQFYDRVNDQFKRKGLALVDDIDRQNNRLLTRMGNVMNEKTSKMVDSFVQNIRIVEAISVGRNYSYGKAILYKHIGLINQWPDSVMQENDAVQRVIARSRLIERNYSASSNPIKINQDIGSSYWLFLALQEAQKTKDEFLMGDISLLIAEEMFNRPKYGRYFRAINFTRFRDSSIIYYIHALNHFQKADLSDSLTKLKLPQIYAGLALAFSDFLQDYNYDFKWKLNEVTHAAIAQNYKALFPKTKSAFNIASGYYKKATEFLCYEKKQDFASKLNHIKCKLFFSKMNKNNSLADSVSRLISTSDITWASSIESRLSQFYYSKKKNDSALKYAKLAVMHADYDDVNTVAMDHLTIGKILLANNKAAEAIEHLKKAEYFDDPNKDNFPQINYQLGEAYRGFFKYDSAFYYLSRAITATEYSNDSIKAKSYYSKYIVADSLRNYTVAANAYRDFLKIDKWENHKDSAFVLLQLETKNQKQVNDLLTEKQTAETKSKNRLIIGTIVTAVLLVLIVIMVFRNHSIKLQNQITETRMRVLLSQLNPHFIFNCLNSIKTLIQSNKNKEAVNYLVQFSGLTRNIFEYSRQDKISLKDEFTFFEKICGS